MKIFLALISLMTSISSIAQTEDSRDVQAMFTTMSALNVRCPLLSEDFTPQINLFLIQKIESLDTIEKAGLVPEEKHAEFSATREALKNKTFKQPQFRNEITQAMAMPQEAARKACDQLPKVFAQETAAYELSKLMMQALNSAPK